MDYKITNKTFGSGVYPNTYFKPMTTLRQSLVHPKIQIPKHQSNVVYTVKCSEESEDLYIEETKQPLYRCMAQHRRANSSSGQDLAVFLHLQQNKHNFHDHEVRILDRENRWFERGVKEAIHVKVESLSLNRREI